MASNNAIFILVAIALMATSIPSIHGSNVVEDEWFQRKCAESINASLQAYNPNPTQVIDHFNYHVHKAVEGTNNTRRGLGVKYRGPCIAQNPIDRCWRCQPDWEQNRKQLVTCVKGFGRETTGGLAGKFYVVKDSSDENLVEPKPGTLRHAVLQPEPLWIIFASDMTIILKGELLVTSNKTIDGRGTMVHIANGAGITIQFAKNVIIHNIKIHDVKPGSGGTLRDTFDHFGTRQVDDGDCIQIFASSNIWIDHLSMWNCVDGLIDIVEGSTAITISNGHFTKQNHVFLFGANDNTEKDELMQITVAFNHFGKQLVQRMPRCRRGFFHVVNNDYTHWNMYAIGGSAHPTIISQGNRYIAPPKPDAKLITHRNDAEPSEWKKWTWRSENDVFLNGAYFVESGEPLKNNSFKKEFISAKEGSYVRRLTRFAGHLKCIKGRKC